MAGASPVRSPWSGIDVTVRVSLHGDTDFPEVGSGLHVAQSVGGLFESEDAIDHRVHFRKRNGPVHFPEHLAGADVNAVHPDRFQQNRPGIHFALPAEDSDERDVAAAADGFDGERQSAGAAHFDHVVHACAAVQRA